MTMPTTTAERRAAVGTTGTTIEMTAAATGTTGTTIVTTETGAATMTGATMTGAMTSTHRQLHRAPSGAVRFMPLRTRIIATVAGLAALSLAGAGAAALVVERERIESRVERLLSQEMAEFRGLASGLDPETGSAFASAERLIDVSMQRNVPDEHETHLGFLAGAIVVPADGGGTLQGDLDFRGEVTRHTAPAFGEFRSPELGRVTYAVMPFTVHQRVNHYVAAYFLDRELAELGDTIRTYAVAAVLAWTALVGAAWLFTARILRPVHELRATAARISDSDLSGRIEVRGDRELAALGQTFNGMLDRLQEALGSQRRMLDDAGHELRTPITVIRGHLELMDPLKVEDVLSTRDLAIDELDRMSGLVEDLLVLAKARRPDFLTPQPTDVADLVRRVVDKASSLAPRAWQVDSAPGGLAVIDPHRLTQALLQLAANAVAVTRDGDAIGMGCAFTQTHVQFWVRDTGPGVPVADRQVIFERWQSGPADRDGSRGTGLGLAIVRAIAVAHSGTVSVTAASPAGGALFIIALPIGEPDATEPELGITRTVSPGAVSVTTLRVPTPRPWESG